jgi:hypothetical protein
MRVRFLQDMIYRAGRIYDVPDDLAQRWLSREVAEIAADPSEPISEAEPLMIDERRQTELGDADFDHRAWFEKESRAAFYQGQLDRRKRMFSYPVQPPAAADLTGKSDPRHTPEKFVRNDDEIEAAAMAIAMTAIGAGIRAQHGRHVAFASQAAPRPRHRSGDRSGEVNRPGGRRQNGQPPERDKIPPEFPAKRILRRISAV